MGAAAGAVLPVGTEAATAAVAMEAAMEAAEMEAPAQHLPT